MHHEAKTALLRSWSIVPNVLMTGVLFLDEVPESGAHVLEVLRQPMEDKVVATNPCPCGYFGDPTRECTCPLSMVSRYQKRLSGPLLDRIDIHIDVPRGDYEKLTDERLGEPSEAIRQRVEKARRRQRERFSNGRLSCNADMGPAEVREYCQTDEAGRSLLRAAMEQLQMSARAFHRVLKLGRTISDLAGAETIETAHLAEAIQYRPRAHM
jgi:magnesium chelatase family protein